MFDVERTEVLRGPQGTLFGRNTTGALVHYISSRPTDEFGGYGNVLSGSDNWVVLEGAVSGPISAPVRARFAGKLNRNDGNRKNTNMTPGTDRSLGAENNWGHRGPLGAGPPQNDFLTCLG